MGEMLDSRRHAAGVCGSGAEGMLRNAARCRRHCAKLAALAALLVAILVPRGVMANPVEPTPGGYLEETLLNFNYADGTNPMSGLIMDAAGNLYGTTQSGGSGRGGNAGVVFELQRTPRGWNETVLYDFCSQNNCTDGYYPVAGLIMDASGNLYGTTTYGGSQNDGVVFELTPNQSRTAWTETVLYSFCSQSQCADGDYPYAGLIMDSSGNLYGTTVGTGGEGCGVVFELTPNQSRTAWTETVLYNFCSQGSDPGENPEVGLIMDASGNLYGTTTYGGSDDDGVVFELTPNQSRTVWTETVLHTFLVNCNGSACTDGYEPGAALIMDAAGNLYGTTAFGGRADAGTVFELTPDESHTQWTYNQLFAFEGGDGAYPYSSLVFGCSRNWSSWQATPSCRDQYLIGTTSGGGKPSCYLGCGVVFALTPNESRTIWTQSVLHSFCSQESHRYCSDGANPYAGVIADVFGNLYGATYGGGATANGTLFELVPPGSPQPRSASAALTPLSTLETPLNAPRQ